MYKVCSWGNISRRKISGNEEDTFFELRFAGPNRFKAAQNATHTPGSFSWPEFSNNGAEPQTATQCLHAVAASRCSRMLVLTCLLLTLFVWEVSLDFCRSVWVVRPPAVCPSADSGAAAWPLAWVVVSARLGGCTRCWSPRLRLHWWLRLISCTRSRRAVVHAFGILLVTLLGEAELVGCA